MMATVATSGVTELFESNQVDAMVASINAAHTTLTARWLTQGLDS